MAWWDNGLESDNTIGIDSSVIKKSNNVDQGYVFPKTTTPTSATSIGSNNDSGWPGLGNIFGGSKTQTSTIDLSKANGMMLQKDANGGYIVPTQFNDKIKSGEMVIGADGKLTDLTAAQTNTGFLGTGMSAGDLASFGGLGMSAYDTFFGDGKKLRAKQMEGLDANIDLAKQQIKSNKQNMADKQSFYSGFARDSNAVSNKVG